jgi:glutathione S-transferase
MVQLIDSDIKTRDVLGWKGVHVLHYAGSSCSQKLRIFLNLKGIPWESHLVDLRANENFAPWFLGINPRGLVPVLIHDGAVHIESNDIITYLERTFPAPRLIPARMENEVAALLKHEDDLHLDLRTLSFRFVFAPPGPPKSAEALKSYAVNGTGTVQGAQDPHKADQIAFWELAAKEGFTDQAARASAHKFRAAFDRLERTLDERPFLLGDTLSVLDIAWFIYVNRLGLAPARRRLVCAARGAARIRQGGRDAVGGRAARRGNAAYSRSGRQVAGAGGRLLTRARHRMMRKCAHAFR